MTSVSERFEIVAASELTMQMVTPGTVLGQDTIEEHGLVLGDPYAAAFVITGTPEELQAAIARMARTLGGLAAVEYDRGSPHRRQRIVRGKGL